MPGDRVLVTGSAGHLGEALVRVLRAGGRDVVGLDLLKAGEDPRSPLARAVGAKGYHPVPTGPYTVR